MLKDMVMKYSNKEEYDLNCAETMVYAGNEEYNLNLSKETLKTMAAFGGGMGVERTCGAISGSLALLSLLYTIDRGHESDRVKNLSQRFIKDFEEKLTTDNCAKLKEKYRKEDIGCRDIIVTAAEIFDEIVKEEGR